LKALMRPVENTVIERDTSDESKTQAGASPQAKSPPDPHLSADASVNFELAQRERQVQALCRINRVLFAYDNLDDTIQQLLETAIEVVEGEVGSVQLYDTQHDTLVFRYVFDPAAPTLIGFTAPVSQGINGRVFRTGVPDISNTVRDKPEWNRTVDERTGYTTQSMLTVPIIRPDGERIGIMQILNGRRRFGKRDLQVLELICAQAAQVIAHAHLRAEADRRLGHLQALRAIDTAITSSLDLRLTLSVFLDQVVAQLNVDAAAVLLLNEATQELEHAAARGFRSRALQHTQLPLGQGHAGQAALERRIICIEDLQSVPTYLARSPLLEKESFITYVAVPLIAKGHVNGVLELFHRRPFSPAGEWCEFLETLAGQAAIAIDNARMFDGLQRSNTELILAYDTTLEGWSRAMDLRDKETEGHTRRVTEATLRLARDGPQAGSARSHAAWRPAARHRQNGHSRQHSVQARAAR
jgi:GAF domain-containing protein